MPDQTAAPWRFTYFSRRALLTEAEHLDTAGLHLAFLSLDIIPYWLIPWVFGPSKEGV